jgi:hypothetical protein
LCIAIYKEKGKVITRETLLECFNHNPDGAGFVYVADGKLYMEKGFFKFQDFYDAYLPHMEHQALIHFRIKTHGAVDKTNCHPFMITNNFAFIHNGTISGHGEKDFSDTYMFNEEVLKPMVKVFGIKSLWQPFMKTVLEDYIGWSKLIFLDSRGNFNIYNEDKGEWVDGVWYSNTSYKPRQTYSTSSSVSNLPTQKIDTRPDGFTQKGQVFYLHRANGFHIYEGDYAEVNKTLPSGLTKGELVEVEKIYSSGYCQVRDVYGKVYYGTAGSVLDYIYFDQTSSHYGLQ